MEDEGLSRARPPTHYTNQVQDDSLLPLQASKGKKPGEEFREGGEFDAGGGDDDILKSTIKESASLMQE